MDNYFATEIQRTESELTALKTSVVKSGTVITAKSQSIRYNVALGLNSAQTSAFGYAYFRVRLDDPAIITVSLDKYIDDLNAIFSVGSQTRYLTCNLRRISGLNYVVVIRGNGNASDITTLAGGESVTLSGMLTVVCTDNFTLEAI